MDPYEPFKGESGQSIAVELVRARAGYPLHNHDFHEFVLVLRGACSHIYRGQEIPLIPGDVFLVPAHQSHGYRVDRSLENYNVQFYPRLLGDKWGKLWEPSLYGGEGGLALDPARHGDLNSLGILRLNPEENEYISSMLGEMHREQSQKSFDYERVLRAYLEIILVIFTRVQSRQFSRPPETAHAGRRAVQKALAYMEGHLEEPVDLPRLAAEAFLSPNYFRTVFKNAVGLSPVDYLNRMRVIRSLRHLQEEGLTVAEAAARVGFADPNYFARLFKRIIGYPPSQARRNEGHEADPQ